MIGINNQSFDELILGFYKVKEELNASFTSLNSLVEELEGEYRSESGRDLVGKYRSFAEANYNTILENIDSYIKDLKSARDNVNSFDSKLSVRIENEVEQFMLANERM